MEKPALAEKFRVKLLATYVPMTNHMVFAAVEAGDADKVRDVAWHGRLARRAAHRRPKPSNSLLLRKSGSN